MLRFPHSFHPNAFPLWLLCFRRWAARRGGVGGHSVALCVGVEAPFDPPSPEPTEQQPQRAGPKVRGKHRGKEHFLNVFSDSPCQFVLLFSVRVFFFFSIYPPIIVLEHIILKAIKRNKKDALILIDTEYIPKQSRERFPGPKDHETPSSNYHLNIDIFSSCLFMFFPPNIS